MSPSPSQVVFEPYRLDISNARLWRGDEPISLTPKALDVLAHLATRPGQLVTKEELLGAVWDDALVTDASLVVCIREIRKALGDQPRSPLYIATVHRRGYRFVAETQEEGSPAERADEEPTGSTESEEGSFEHSPAGLRPPASAPRVELVGRDTQLAQLTKHFETARQGRRQIVLIAGDAGSGKTGLVESFLAGVPRDKVWFAEGQSFEQFGTGEPYLPVLEAIAQLCRDTPGQQVVELLRTHAPTWLVQLPSLLAAVSDAVTARDVLGATAERMLREITDVFETLAQDATLVLTLEDVHWSDYSTLDLISHLAHRRQPARLLVLATYRPVDIILSGHPFKGIKQEMHSRGLCTELALGRLAAEDVRQYLARQWPACDVPEELSTALHQRTDGHPLFVVNLVDYLRSAGSLHPVEPDPGEGPADESTPGQPARPRLELKGGVETIRLVVPDTIRAMIEKQIDRLDARQQRLLEAASVAGIEFSAAAVAHLVGDDVLDAEEACEELARREQFLKERDLGEWPDGSVASRYRFLHVMYQEVFYQRLPAGRRVRLHQQLATRLEEAFGAAAAEIAAELAVHFEQARRFADAIRYLCLAAERATRRYANREAADYLNRALELVPRIAADQRYDTLLHILEQRGLLHRASSDLTEAAADFRQVAELAGREGDPDRETRALNYLASVLSWVDPDGCLAAAARAVEVSSLAPDLSLHDLTHGWSAYWNLLWRGWSDDDAHRAETAVATARQTGDPAVLGAQIGRYAFFLALRSQYQQADAAAAEGIELALKVGDASEYLLCLYFQTWALLHRGHWSRMQRQLDDGLQIAEKNGHRRWAILLRLQLAWLHSEMGDHGRAVEVASQSQAEATELQLPYGEMVGGVLVGLGQVGLQQLDSAEQNLAAIETRLDQHPVLLDRVWRMPLQFGLAHCAVRQGEHAVARRHAGQLGELAEHCGERTYEMLARWLELESELAARLESAAAWDDPLTICAGLDEVAWGTLPERTPLAAWRVDDVLARWYSLRGDSAQADISRQRSQDVIARLRNPTG